MLQMLGKALGIPENSVKTYTEAEIRAGYDNALSLNFNNRRFKGILICSVFNSICDFLSSLFLHCGFHYDKHNLYVF